MQEDKRLLSSVIKVARDSIKANRAKTELISNLSYELRSALTSILGMAQLLSMDCLLPTQQQYVTDILHVCESILSLINRSLNLSEREMQQIGLKVRSFNLKLLLEKVIKQLLFQAKTKGIQFLLDYPHHVPVDVLGDLDLIHQIVIHLSSQALKNTEQGTVILQVAYESSKRSNEPHKFSISIKDNGIGMQKNELANLRACLAQTDSYRTRNYRHVDLGMAITLTYIKLLNGSIVVESSPGKGSLFICQIPLKQTKILHETITPPKTSLTSLDKLHILLIEDNEIIRLVYKSMLEKIAGCSVDSASSAQMALEYYMQSQYDLIFMDICLPDSDGVVITQIIRQQETKGERIPIIAVTACDDVKDKEKFLEAGIDEVLIKPKPINLEEIILLLEKWVSKTKVSEPSV
ncbi:MAG: response regulator [Rickettsiella sp.]|nr:response regulator [Rickettsiella sp.]